MTKHIAERKKLLKRFKGFRTIVGDDPAMTDPTLMERLDAAVESLERPIRIVLAGLADARHHDLASQICGTPLTPDTEAAMACPALLIRAAAEPRTATSIAGRNRVFKGCVLDKLIGMGAQEPVSLQLPGLMAPHIELSVLPIYDTQDDRSRYLFDLVDKSDAIIWCSDAASPWQPRERRLWFTVPDDLKSHSILAMTFTGKQADDMDSKAAIEDKREITNGEFAHTVTIRYDEDVFAKDVLGLMDVIAAMVDEPVLAAARTLRSEIDTIPIGTITSAPSLPPVPTPPSQDVIDTDPAPDDIRLMISRNANACIEAVARSTPDDRAVLFEAMTTLLSQTGDALKDGVKLSRDHDALGIQVSEANDLVSLLSYEGTALAVQEAADLVCQIAIDVLDRLPMAGNDEQIDTTTLRKAS